MCDVVKTEFLLQNMKMLYMKYAKKCLCDTEGRALTHIDNFPFRHAWRSDRGWYIDMYADGSEPWGYLTTGKSQAMSLQHENTSKGVQ